MYTADTAWVRFVYQQLNKHVDDVSTIRCLGSCVSVAHAQFMATRFQEIGVKAVAIWAETPDALPRQQLSDPIGSIG